MNGSVARRYAPWFVVAFALLIYAPTLTFHRIDYDDQWLWADESPLRQLDRATLHDLFFDLDARTRHSYGTEYLPVRDVLVAADMALWGEDDRGPHITQLAFYALIVVGIGTLLVGFGVPRHVAWLGTMIWVAHPLGVQSVAWLSERKGILAALFTVACGHAWLRYRSTGAMRWLAAAAVAAICATWSKAPAMFAPIVFATWDLLLLERGRTRWFVITVCVGAATLAAVPVAIVAADAGVVANSEHGLAIGRGAVALGAFGHYMQSLMLLHAPSPSYPIQTHGPSPLDYLFGSIGVIAMLVAARFGAARETRRLYIALLAWACIWFVPVSHLIARVHILVADRYVFLWSLSPCVGIILLLQRLHRSLQTAVIGALICVLAIATIRALGAWTNSVELFERGCNTNPADIKMCGGLAGIWMREGESAQALDALERGLAASPDEPHLLMRKADVLWRTGDPTGALEAARIAARSKLSSAAWTYARLLADSGHPRDALPWAARAAFAHPEIEQYQQTWRALIAQPR